MTDSTPYKSIKNAAAATGCSQYFIRNGIKNGTVPHIRSGNKYLINVPLWIEQLNEQSRKEVVNG